MGDATKNVLDFLDFPPFRITFKLLYCSIMIVAIHLKVCWSSLSTASRMHLEKPLHLNMYTIFHPIFVFGMI